MKYFIRVLLTPACWFQNEPYSEELDRKLNALIDSGVKFEIGTHYRAQIGPLNLWIANHPYASFIYSGKDYFTASNFRVRPSRKTILKAYDHLVHSELNEVVK